MLLLILGIIGMTQEYRHRTATPTFLTDAPPLAAWSSRSCSPTRWSPSRSRWSSLAVNVLVVAIYAGARGAAPSLTGDNLRVARGVRAWRWSSTR